ncbi:UBQ, helicase-c and DEAD-like helicase domain-containing protein [Trema orientale]|uniref:UBQ, helicase-c and DEAD-like helicase domain-containing protein n=1 Tax=Trema orientale TaxID=63057 RepID=A0A2P5EBU8_TREOI|nr:UBQ, helicase-c and DEAD-like helicase domain-containing protein [Trema orientale]
MEEVVVRTISGESTTVKLSSNSTIEDLKILLRQNFSPATQYPNFHLYFKGVKLGLQSRISTLNIGHGEILVIVPFIKNVSNRTPKSDQAKTSVNATNANSISKFADLAWNEMMRDFSFLRDSARTVDQNAETGSSNIEDREEEMSGTARSSFSKAKRKRANGCDDLNSNIDANVSWNTGKKARESSASSSSSSDPKSFRVKNSLPPLEMVEHLRKGAGSYGQIVHVEDIGGRKATYVEIPNKLSEKMISALKHIGVTKLYSHQAESIEASLAGKSVVVATATSSGKSLCYNVPVLEVLSQNMLSCALYLFPTKALCQDQLRALLVLTKDFDCGLNIGIYDGDTPKFDGTRSWLRVNSRLLITNPDMLHLSILPKHRQFQRILSNLRFIVVDEAHFYKGAFGCHTALILRRLCRLCAHVYGSHPSFVFSTATSANPREHCMELANLPEVELIQNDGSPSARKLFVLWNPIASQKNVSKETHGGLNSIRSIIENSGLSSSPALDVSLLFAEMVKHGLRCIAFCKTRKLCELVLDRTRDILSKTASHLVDSICAYRAGYIAEDRRRIERDFFGGKLCGVASTNALELGIDVGHIDVTLHLGFPGTIASLWQQAGRAGRRGRHSLAIYVAFNGPLDQYFMKNPRKLFGSPIECCHIDSQNHQVLEQHLACAALEHPLSLIYDEKYFGPGLSNAIVSLKNKGCLSSDPSCDLPTKMWNYIGPKEKEKHPSRSFNIRAIENVKYQVKDLATDATLEEIEESKAFFQVYEGAVYMRQGKSYLVRELDLSSKTAWCKEAHLDYYTRPRDCTDIEVIGGNIAYPVRVPNIQFSRTTARADPCKVTTSWFGFYRVLKKNNLIFDKVDFSLPKYSYMSQAVWVPVPQSTKLAILSTTKDLDFRAGLHAASHALLNAVPLRIICNLSDLAPECANPHDNRYFPERILLYDKHPGGTGVSVQVQPFFMELLTTALELLTTCRCSGHAGCPHCVQSFACKEYNEVLHKDLAIKIIKGVLDAEES